MGDEVGTLSLVIVSGFRVKGPGALSNQFVPMKQSDTCIYLIKAEGMAKRHLTFGLF